jgi:hypothetical protein
VLFARALEGVMEVRVTVLEGLTIAKPPDKVADCPSLLVTITFQLPAVFPVIGNVQVSCVAVAETIVPVILVCPEVYKTTEAPEVEKPEPVMTTLLIELLL